MKRFLPQSVFARNVLILASGTTLAQAIPILVSPLLTRIYTPEEFGIFAFYMAILSILSVIATARYELAVMLPKDDIEAANLLMLSFSIAILFSLLIFSFLLLLSIDNLILFLLPISIFLTGIFQALTYWNNRTRKFSNLSTSKLLNSLVMISAQVILGLTKISNYGLFLGFILGQIAGVIALIAFQYSSLIKYKTHINIKLIKSMADTHKDKPLLSTLGGLIDSIAYQVPTLAVTHLFGLSSIGFYNFASRTINIPLSLIGSAIGQVSFQHIARLSENDPPMIEVFVKKTLILMLAFSVPVFLLLSFTIDHLFAFIFGEAWREAGHYAALMCIPAIVRFPASPLSVVFLLKENTRIGVYWQISHIFFISIGIFISWLLKLDTWYFACIIITIDFIIYSFYLFLILKTSKSKIKEKL